MKNETNNGKPTLRQRVADIAMQTVYGAAGAVGLILGIGLVYRACEGVIALFERL